MGTNGYAAALKTGCRKCAALLEAMGYGLDLASLSEALADGECDSKGLLRVLEGARNGLDEEAAERAAARLEGILQGLVEQCRQAAEANGVSLPKAVGSLTRRLSDLPAQAREAVADAVLLNGFRRFIEPRWVEASRVRACLAARRPPLSVVKAVPRLREELAARGFEFSESQLLRALTGAEEVPLPECTIRIVRGLGPEFDSGLIPIEQLTGGEDPERWLESVRERLLFRSHTAMHKAIAEVTSLKYDCIHKALSGPQKARRIRAEVKHCLDRWLAQAEAGQEPDIPERYRGIPIEQMVQVLEQLADKIPSKEELYRRLSRATGIKAASVRRYFQADGQLRHAPLCVWRCARALLEGKDLEVRQSACSPRQERAQLVVRRLARRASEVLRQWQRVGAPELHRAYRQLRRELIVAIKERHRRARLAV